MIRSLLYRGGVLLLGVVVAMSLTGCHMGLSADSLLAAPRIEGEQQQIEEALKQYLYTVSKGDSTGSTGYELIYPHAGDYRSACILKDMNNDGIDEAIVFYRQGTEVNSAHIHLLTYANEAWQSVGDAEGVSGSIEEVAIADLDGNGVYELVAGYTLSNVRDRQMVVYSLDEHGLHDSYKGLYSQWLLTDLTACGHDNLLVLRAALSDASATAQLWTGEYNTSTGLLELTQLGAVSLDNQVQSFSRPQAGKLNNTLYGAFVDGTYATGGTITELVYWDGGKLVAPLNANRNLQLADSTYRESPMASRDIDGDYMVEWPFNRRLYGFSGTDVAQTWWQTDWMSWDHVAKAAVKEFASIVNEYDGYYLRLDSTWDGKVTVSYERESRTLTLYAVPTAIVPDTASDAEAESVLTPLLTVQTVQILEDGTASSNVTGSKANVLTFESTGDRKYVVEYDTASFSEDGVRYMFAYLAG